MVCPGGPVARVTHTGQGGLGGEQHTQHYPVIPVIPDIPLSMQDSDLCARSVSAAPVAMRSQNQPYSFPSFFS